jgi:hypothetical protein
MGLPKAFLRGLDSSWAFNSPPLPARGVLGMLQLPLDNFYSPAIMMIDTNLKLRGYTF